MKTIPLFVLGLIWSGVISRADDKWVEVNEGFRFELPSDWTKKEVRAIDSHQGRYEGAAGHLWFDRELGFYTADAAREAIQEMKAKEANPKLLMPGEEIWRIDGRLVHFRSSGNVVSLFVPCEERFWILSIEVTFYNPGFLPSARRILRSFKFPTEKSSGAEQSGGGRR